MESSSAGFFVIQYRPFYLCNYLWRELRPPAKSPVKFTGAAYVKSGSQGLGKPRSLKSY